MGGSRMARRAKSPSCCLRFGAEINGLCRQRSCLIASLGAERVSTVLIGGEADLERTSIQRSRALHWPRGGARTETSSYMIRTAPANRSKRTRIFGDAAVLGPCTDMDPTPEKEEGSGRPSEDAD